MLAATWTRILPSPIVLLATPLVLKPWQTPHGQGYSFLWASARSDTSLMACRSDVASKLDDPATLFPSQTEVAGLETTTRSLLYMDDGVPEVLHHLSLALFSSR